MKQGLVIVLPLILFFLIDVTLFVNSLRQRNDTATAVLFSKLSGCVMISQGLTALTYACDWQLLFLSIPVQYLMNLISLFCMTIASYLWFEYLLLTGRETQKYLAGHSKKILFIPVIIVMVTGILSPWTHWLFYIDSNGVYQPGSWYILQFMGFIYYLSAMVLTIRQLGRGESVLKTLGRFFLFLIPTLIGTVLNTTVIRGGYTQIGCSYAVFLLYLEQYISEVYENKRLKNVENQNRDLQDVNNSLVDQMNIIGGLANAYFSAYSVNLKTGRCQAIKVIDDFRKVVNACNITQVVTKAFIQLCVMPEDRGKMKEFTNSRTLAYRLEDTDLIVEEFHGMISPWEWCRASWIVSSRDGSGRADSVLFTVEDVTATVKERMRHEQEREEAQRALEASQAAAEAANKAKTDFLFNMSHDIRTPMNAILGYADLMEKHFGEAEKCMDYLNKIKKSSDFLLSLVNNVLEMARIESGKMVLDEHVYRVSDLIGQVSSVYEDLMKQKQITFTTDISVAHEYYYADMVKLSEIFLNIVSNAYKYTEEGGRISVSVKELPGKSKDEMLIETVVTDTGIGMSQEFLPVLFEEFSREHTSTESKVEGTGLGMPIVKKLVEIMGGTIEVTSEVARGSVFTVTIPHRIAEEAAITEKENCDMNLRQFEGKRILLAEDNELNMEIATEILEELGFQVEQAKDGKICMDMLIGAKPDYYDLILMDVQMPNLDGYSATKKIRNLSDQRKAQIPIIAMTANAFEEDKKNALEAGMNGHLAKPMEIAKLMRTLSECLQDTKRSTIVAVNG